MIKQGDLVEYIDSEYTIGDKRRFYLTLYDEIFDGNMHVWYCIPINLGYSITWIRSITLVKINDI